MFGISPWVLETNLCYVVANAWTIQNFMVVDIVYEPVMRAQGGF